MFLAGFFIGCLVAGISILFYGTYVFTHYDNLENWKDTDDKEEF